MRILICLAMATLLAWGKLAEMSTFASTFTQQVKSEEGGVISYRGFVYAKAPGYGLWKYEKPVQKEIYIKDREVIIHEPDLEQATFTSLEQAIDFFALLKHAKEVKMGLYETTLFGQSYTILADSKGIPQAIHFTDTLGNEVKIQFETPQINRPLEEGLFRFIPYSGLDIIRQ